MPDVVTLTLNPAVDLAASVERIVPTHKMRCSSAMRDPGGGGINVARAVHRFGIETRAIFPAGGAIGNALCEMLEGEGVAHAAIPIAGDTREDVNILETTTGQEYRFVMEGPSLSAQDLDACLAALSKVGRCRYLVASGSLPPGVPPDFHRRLVPIARELDAKLIVDTSGPALNAALGDGLYMIKPSLRELETTVGEDLDSIPKMIGACRNLISHHKVEIIALSLGAMGALAVNDKHAWQVRTPRVTAVGTVGSGDSFLAGLVVALMRGANLADACRMGVAAGSAAISSLGTKLCQPAQVETYLGQIHAVPSN